MTTWSVVGTERAGEEKDGTLRIGQRDGFGGSGTTWVRGGGEKGVTRKTLKTRYVLVQGPSTVNGVRSRGGGVT